MQIPSRRPLVVVILLSAFLAGCGGSSPEPSAKTSPSARPSPSASAFPATVTSAGTTITIEKRPTSIVSLSPTATEMLYAIGAGEQVSAVDEYSTYPKDAPRTKLSGLQPNVEAILSKKPDLVVASGDAADFRKRLTDLKVPVLLLPAATKLDDVYAELDDLGTATGHGAEAKDESQRIRGQIDHVVASVPTPATQTTYYYELGSDYYSLTSDTFVGRLLALLGMRSIADKAGNAADGGYPQLSVEYILKADPDYILLADTVCCQQTAKTVAARPGWSKLRAVRNSRIIPLNDDIASRWGPRVGDLLQAVADGIARR